MEPLSNYLKTFRKRSGLTQQELAGLLGCKSGSMIARYERGDRFPAFDAMLGYEVIFRQPIKKLFAGEDFRAEKTIRRRAQELFKRLDTEEFTAVVKRKMDFLTDLMYPPSRNP